MACDFTRADVDSLCRVLNEASRLEWQLESDIVKEFVKPSAPIRFISRATFDHIAKVTGAKVDRDVTPYSTSKSKVDMLSYKGVLFYSFEKGAA